MVDKKFSSDNPWAEMSGLNIGNKEAKAPSQPPQQTPQVPRTPEVKEAAPAAAPVVAAAVAKGDEGAEAIAARDRRHVRGAANRRTGNRRLAQRELGHDRAKVHSHEGRAAGLPPAEQRRPAPLPHPNLRRWPEPRR